MARAATRLVSAVIPTCNRPHLVIRAVRSALDQTYSNLEVIVVIDGPDLATQTALQTISDSRLRVIALPERVGGSDARNVGVRAARGAWVAFLDDDDVWLPSKIAKQTPHDDEPGPFIVSCQVLKRTAQSEEVTPLTPPSRPVCEYLFARRSRTAGNGLLQTSTLLVSRELLLEVPFCSGLPRHQDYDWVLRATARPEVQLRFIAEPLAVWDLHLGGGVGNARDWRFSLQWIRQRRAVVTARGYSAFVISQVATQAVRQRAWSAFPTLMWDILHGEPTGLDLSLFFAIWFVPEWARQLLRDLGVVGEHSVV